MSPTLEPAASMPAGGHRVVLLRRSIAHALDSSDLLALSLERLERKLRTTRRRCRRGRLWRSTDALRGSQAALVSAAQLLRRSAVAVVPPAAAQAVS